MNSISIYVNENVLIGFDLNDAMKVYTYTLHTDEISIDELSKNFTSPKTVCMHTCIISIVRNQRF